jgi:hypothetical protein
MIDEKKLQESIDRSEIINLISKSILVRDAGFWEKLAECYHSKAEVSSSWYKGKATDFIKVASEKLEESRLKGGEQKHVNSNHWIQINGDRAIVESDQILFMRNLIKGVDLDVTTWSRRLQLVAKENGDWKILRRWVIYERDRMDPVDPTETVESYYDAKALSKHPVKLRYHLWRNEMLGLAPEKHNILRGSEQDDNAREEAQTWLEGK